MKKVLLAVFTCMIGFTVLAQSPKLPPLFNKDSALRAAIHKDSVKIETRYANIVRWRNLVQTAEYPAIKGFRSAGVFPVRDISEFPDTNMKYKLLYETHQKNPDSLMDKPDENLVSVAHIINMHVAAGVPLKNISVVIVTHGPGNAAILSNAVYHKKYGMNNPNMKLIGDLENMGARFIVCGQSMDFGGLSKSDILPVVHIAFSAQTTFTTYQLKGYVLKTLDNK